MNKEKYLELRNGLYTEAEALINEGKLEEGQAKMVEIENLDSQFENSAKALANLNALKDSSKISNIAPVVRENKIGSIMEEDFTNSIEYRKSFMNHILTGKPMELSNNAFTKTTDVQSVIPTTIMQKIIAEIESQGMILNEISRTSYKAGLAIPVSNGGPVVASWVQEGAGSATQKTTTTQIVFAWHKLRCAINMSLEVSITSLDVFERHFIQSVSSAMVKALEQSIVSGDGNGQCKGILMDTNLDAARNVLIAANKEISYKDIVTMESLLPMEYEAGAVYFMSKKTFLEIASMTDSTGQPIGGVTRGIDGRFERTILGRRVVLTNYIPATAKAGLSNSQIVAFLVNPKDYYLNTNLEMTTSRYVDNLNEDIIWKSVALVDGQLTQNYSLITMSKAQ